MHYESSYYLPSITYVAPFNHDYTGEDHLHLPSDTQEEERYCENVPAH